MSFYTPQGLRQYFSAIDRRSESEPKFDLQFDKFYYCLLIGLATRAVSTDIPLEAEFAKAYPADYGAFRDVIAGLLIDAELERKGIEPEDRASIESEVLRLLDPSSVTHLSEEGQRLLNTYAAAGFGVMKDAIQPQPTTLEDFLLSYFALLEHLTNNAA